MGGKEVSLRTDGRVTVWLGALDGSSGTPYAKPPVKLPIPDFPWLKKDLPPATVKDDDPTIQWGDFSGKINYDATPSEDLRLHIGSWIDLD